METLIDKARLFCKNDADLAKKLGVSKPALSMMKHGHRAITMQKALRLGEIAGLSAGEALELAALQNDKHGEFRDFLGRVVVVGVVGLLGFSYSGNSISAPQKIASEFTRLHIVFSRVRALLRWARGLAGGVHGDLHPHTPGPARGSPVYQ